MTTNQLGNFHRQSKVAHGNSNFEPALHGTHMRGGQEGQALHRVNAPFSQRGIAQKLGV